MALWTAFLLGLVGSLHCAGMCGPLAIAVAGNRMSSAGFVLGGIGYNAGRLMTYCLMGGIFGLVGKSFAVVGLQRWLSLLIGAVILLGLIFSARWRFDLHLSKQVVVVKNLFARLLSQRSFVTTCSLGALNGFLPCGLVYAACAGAAAESAFTSGILYMFVFGLGTVPMMLGIGLVGRKLQFTLRFKFQKLIPITLVLMSLLLILRGLALNIPYVSPDLAHASCCHDK